MVRRDDDAAAGRRLPLSLYRGTSTCQPVSVASDVVDLRQVTQWTLASDVVDLRQVTQWTLYSDIVNFRQVTL